MRDTEASPTRDFGPQFDLGAYDGDADGWSMVGWDGLLPVVTLGVPGYLMLAGVDDVTVNVIGFFVSITALFVRASRAQRQLEERFEREVPHWRVFAVLAALLSLTAVDFCGNVILVVRPVPMELVNWSLALYVAYFTFMFLGVWSNDWDQAFGNDWE